MFYQCFISFGNAAHAGGTINNQLSVSNCFRIPSSRQPTNKKMGRGEGTSTPLRNRLRVKHTDTHTHTPALNRISEIKKIITRHRFRKHPASPLLPSATKTAPFTYPAAGGKSASNARAHPHSHKHTPY